jgi:hypothetical protein
MNQGTKLTPALPRNRRNFTQTRQDRRGRKARVSHSRANRSNSCGMRLFFLAVRLLLKSALQVPVTNLRTRVL